MIKKNVIPVILLLWFSLERLQAINNSTTFTLISASITKQFSLDLSESGNLIAEMLGIGVLTQVIERIPHVCHATAHTVVQCYVTSNWAPLIYSNQNNF